MRISDWSSDVCSSDLGLSKAKRSTLAARSRYGQDEAWRRPKKPKNQLPDEQGGPLDKPRKHFRGKFSVSPAMSSLPTDSVVQRLNGLLQKQASPSARLRPLRSEEHTSELQSLMRISYAVFCLKKKNK